MVQTLIETPEPSDSQEPDFQHLVQCAVDTLSVEPEQVTLKARFKEDLEADSLDLVEFVMALEEAYDVSIEEEELEGVETVGQSWELVQTKVRAA